MDVPTPHSILRRWGITLALVVTISVFALHATVNVVQAHGGKTHSEAFTALQALQKATELFDKLVVSGKLEESWETALEKVEVAVRDHQDAREYRVGFHRGLGDPTAVYIFLNAKGEYSGSNFDGKW